MRKFTKHFTPVACLLITIVTTSIAPAINAQDILTGLTSNGGPEGKGTAFSIKSNGTSFSIIKGFADWGRVPKGDLYRHTDGNFYGMTSAGGIYDDGTIFKMSSTGAITIIRNFDYTNDGAYPEGELIKGPDGNMWGMTSSGGSNTTGVIFKLTTAAVFTVVHVFDYTADGSSPHGHLVLGKDGNFYGITAAGGTYGYGTIFKMTPSGTYSVLRHLNGGSDGGPSYGSITEGSDGNLYGMTYGGGTNNIGTIIKISKTGSGFTVLRNFTYATDGGYSRGDLVQATDGFLYGMTAAGGVNGHGIIFKIKTTGGSFADLRDLTGTDGENPTGGLVQHTDGFLYGLAYGGGAHGGGTFFKISTAGAFTPLYAFTPDTDGGYPDGGVIVSSDGNLYGMTSDGGPNFLGTAFKVTTSGTFTLLASFNGATLGNTPYESLVRGNDSAFYGTTSNGGGNRYYGAIFKICAGNTTLLHTFDGTTGGNPKGSLVQASNGIFYGTTEIGGTNNAGTIFKITKSGTYTVLKNLTGATDGEYPNGSLIQGTDGNLYGMNYSGGANSGGTIFKITLTGTLTVLRHLSTADGYYPYGGLIQGTDGNFYGCTSTGGANGGGTIFKITSTGTFTVLRNLASGDGTNPYCSLVQHPNGNFYGTTTQGGNNGGGTIFRISSAGSFQVLKHLTTATNGGVPKGSLFIGTDTSLYGMTSDGGSYDAGTIFKITTTGTYTVLRNLNLVTDGGTPYGSLIIFPANTLVANAQSLTTKEDTKKNITLTGSGASPLSFNIVTSPKHGTLTGTGAARVYKPAANYNGKDSFSFNVSFNCINSDPAKINITVTAVADTPVLAPIGNKTIKKDSTLTFTAKATDGDKGDVLTFSLIGAPAGASINGSTGVFTWTPTSTGSFMFKVRVTDNSALLLYDEETITVTVTTLFAKNDRGAQMDATIYPNPVHDKLIVSLNTTVESLAATITDTRGFELARHEIQLNGVKSFEINVSELSPGTYFLRLKTKDEIKVFNFVKEE